MHTLLLAPPLASVVGGTAVPILWVIGIALVAWVVALVRRRLIRGVVMILIGIFLGSLSVFWSVAWSGDALPLPSVVPRSFRWVWRSPERFPMHAESHRGQRIGWLRAATLGANDGLISTSSLIVGVASATPTRAAVLLAAVAGLVSGALAMAAGEYVSVSSQADTEQADLSREQGELATSPEAERAELAAIYADRGLSHELAGQVADQLMAHDALGAHASDELGIHETRRARPIQAAVASAASFTVGAAPPALLAALLPVGGLTLGVVAVALGLLLVLGGVAARLGGASLMRGALRVAFWGAVAMGCTAAAGRLVSFVL